MAAIGMNKVPSLPAHLGVEILRSKVGSKVYGTSSGGDEDFMGIYVARPEYVTGLSSRNHWTWRSAEEGVQSTSEDIDLTVYELRRWASLAVSCNPSVLIPLFTSVLDCPIMEIHGRIIKRSFPPLIWSQRAGDSFCGYLHSQRLRFTGEKARHGRVRPELIEEFGYDTKYAHHMIRLGYQGIEFLEYGKLTLPLPPPALETCRDVRAGKYTKAEVCDMACELEDVIARKKKLAPESPKIGEVNSLLHTITEDVWKYYD